MGDAGGESSAASSALADATGQSHIFTGISALLIVVIISTSLWLAQLIKRLRLNWLSDSGAAMLLGVLVGLDPGERAHALLALGFCGALTTWSAFSVQAHGLGWRRGTLLVAVTLPPAILLCWLGSQL